MASDINLVGSPLARPPVFFQNFLFFSLSSQPQVSKSAAYPRAGLIFRSNSFRSQTSPERRVSGSSDVPLSRTGSLRCSPGRFVIERQDSTSSAVVEENAPATATTRRDSSSVVQQSTTTTTRSFLQDRSKVGGMQDVIGRMSATPTVTGNVFFFFFWLGKASCDGGG